MDRTALPWLRRSLAAAVTASLFTACADGSSVGPDRSALVAQLSATSKKDVDLGACQNLQVPAGNKQSSRVFANGVQIYKWNGTSWAFVAPEAVLTAAANGEGVVGTHYAGPTWESNSGSKVVGAVIDRCTPNPNAVAWLLLGAVSAEGPGIYNRVTFIQRVNTVGGIAPANPGSVVGEEASVRYTTEYVFYKAK